MKLADNTKLPNGMFAKRANRFLRTSKSAWDIPMSMAFGPWAAAGAAPSGEKLRHFIPAYLKNMTASTIGAGLPILLGTVDPMAIGAGSALMSTLSSLKSYRLARAAAEEAAAAERVRRGISNVGTVAGGALAGAGLARLEEEEEQPQLEAGYIPKQANLRTLLLDKATGLLRDDPGGTFVTRLGLSSPLAKIKEVFQRPNRMALEDFSEGLFGRLQRDSAGEAAAAASRVRAREGVQRLADKMNVNMDKLETYTDPYSSPWGALYAPEYSAKDVGRMIGADPMPRPGHSMLYLPGEVPDAGIVGHELGHAALHEGPFGPLVDALSFGGTLGNILLGPASLMPASKKWKQRLNKASLLSFLPRVADEAASSALGLKGLAQVAAESGLSDAAQAAIVNQARPAMEGALGTYAGGTIMGYKLRNALIKAMHAGDAPNWTRSAHLNELLRPLSERAEKAYGALREHLPAKSFYERVLTGKTNAGPDYTGSLFE